MKVIIYSDDEKSFILGVPFFLYTNHAHDARRFENEDEAEKFKQKNLVGESVTYLYVKE